MFSLQPWFRVSLLFVKLIFLLFTGASTVTTAPVITTTTVPPVTVKIVNNKGSSDPKPEQCEPGTWAAVVFVLEKDKDPDDAHTMHYILCKTYNGMALTTETLISTDPAENCPPNYALVGLRGEKSGDYTWHDAETVQGICRQVEGWIIDYNNCTDITTTIRTGSNWQKDEFGTGNEDDWNRYFECPHQTLAVQIATELDGSKARYTSASCCFMTPSSSASPGFTGSTTGGTSAGVSSTGSSSSKKRK